MGIDIEFWVIFVKLVLGLTYLVVGFVVAFEVVLGMGGSKTAQQWIKTRHKYKNFYVAVMLFYPMILLGYFFLELVPHYLFGKRLVAFDMQKLFDQVYGTNHHE
jgi:hypothetical protein